ncbi:unnamed protein product [Heterobilharzia americana]|nr:unnamed protein product [Heterobilharzia americana]
MDVDKHTLVIRNLQEVIGDDELQLLLQRQNQPMAVYWGTATTGRPHVAYFVPIIKLADMLRAGAKVTVLFADLHAYLDNMKAPWSLLRLRTKYYETVIKGMFRSICVPLDRLHFIRGADYQLTKEYSIDVYRLIALTSVHDARKAGAEVVKQVTNPLVSGLLYPLLQALDEIHLNVDAQFGGVDQRKIFMLAEKYLPHLGHKKRVHLMNPMVPGLTGAKMSSSEADSKIDLLDQPDVVSSKLSSSVCPPNMTAEQGNGVLAFLKYVVFPLVPVRTGLSIPRTPKPYYNYNQVEQDYLAKKIPPDSLRSIVTNCLNGLLETVQHDFKDPTLQKLVCDAYPMEGKEGAAYPGHEELTMFTAEKPYVLQEVDDRINHIPKITDKSTLLDAFEREFVGCKSLLEQRLTKTDRLRCLWSITPIGLPHLGHTIPLRSLARLSHLDGVYIIALINNISAHLRGSLTWDVIKQRGEFCRVILNGIFSALNGRMDRFSCVLGSDFQLSSAYMLDFYRLVSLVPETDCLISSDLSVYLVDVTRLAVDVRIASPVRTQKRQIFQSKFMRYFPILSMLFILHTQCLVSCSLASRCLGPTSAKALAALAEDNYIPLVEPPVPGSTERFPLSGLKRRIKRAFCQPNNIDINPILDICRWVLIPDLQLEVCYHEYNSYVVLLAFTDCFNNLVGFGYLSFGEKWWTLHITSKSSTLSQWDLLKQHFSDGSLHPGDLKPAVEQLLSINNEKSFANSLRKSLPKWDEIMHLLDAAFPLPKSKGKDKQGKQASQKVANPPSQTNNAGDSVASRNESTGSKEGIPNLNGKEILPTQNSVDELNPNRLDIRVGLVLSVRIHPNADSLFVEEVDFGSEIGKRTVVSGLVGLYPMEKLLGLHGIFVINLKPVKIRGIESQAMLLCASYMDTSSSLLKVQPIYAPEESVVLGERFIFHSSLNESNCTSFTGPDKLLNPKTKLWEHLCPDLLTSVGQYVQWRNWRLGSVSGNQWICVPGEVPPGSTVR